MNNDTLLLRGEDLHIGELYHIKFSDFTHRRIKDPVIRVDSKDEENGILNVTYIGHNTEATFDFNVNKYIKVSEDSLKLPKEEYTDYTNIIEDGVALKMLANHPEYYLCNIRNHRYYVDRRKFKSFVSTYYRDKYRVKNDYYLSCSCELIQSLLNTTIHPLTKIPMRVLGKKEGGEIIYYDIYDNDSDRLYDKDDYVPVKIDDNFILGYIKTSPIVRLITLTTCNKSFSLREIYTVEFLKSYIRGEKDGLLHILYLDDTSIFPSCLYFGMVVHIDRNIRRILTPEQKLLFKEGHIKTITILFRVNLTHVNYSLFTEDELSKLIFKVYLTKERIQAIKTSDTISTITKQIMDSNLSNHITQRLIFS